MTAPEPQLPLVGSVLGDTYRILRLVAVGGMGELYEATHLRLSGRYAVKVLLPQFATYEEVLQRFAREAEITSRLRHPNIVSVLDFNTTPDGRAFLAMEFLEGRDLAAELDREGAMPLPRVLDIVGQVISSLEAAHAQGVVHRDLKPQNLFITRLPGDGREMVKVLDFGISKVREARTKLTREHTIIGTPQYMAPEQALGQGFAVDHRTDQFSLASITYELLTGQEAFRAETIPAILYLVVHEEPPSLSTLRPDLPPGIEQVLVRALAKNPADRFPDIGSFGHALAAAAQPLGSRRTHRETSPPRVLMSEAPTLRDERRNTTFGASTAELGNEMMGTLRRPRQRMQFGGILLVGAALAGGLAFLASRREPAAPPAPSAVAPAPLPVPRPATPWPPPAAKPATPPAAESPAPVAEKPARAPAPAASTPPESSPPQPAPAYELGTAPLDLSNAPPGLRLSVDGVRVALPTELARRPGRYVLRFESPGRQSAVIEVDAMAARHDIRLDMPRVRARAPITDEEEDAPANTTVPTPLPAPEPTAPAPAPAPAPQEPPPAEEQVPLIDDL